MRRRKSGKGCSGRVLLLDQACIVTERLGNSVKHLIGTLGVSHVEVKIEILTLMLKALLNDHPTLQTISVRFLVSGHSWATKQILVGSNVP